MENIRDLLRQFIDAERNKDAGTVGNQDVNPDLEEKIKESGYNPDSLRDLLDTLPPEQDTDEVIDSIFKVLGKEITFIKPTKISDDGFISKSISTKETEQGLEREVLKPLIVAACGKVIKEEDIGVRCSTCNQYDCKDHAFVCHACGNGLCILHTLFFKNEKGENIPYCPGCYKTVIYNQYTW
jgi:hypothetical protein